MQYPYDEFIDTNPDVMARVAKACAEAYAKAYEEGKIQAKQETILRVFHLCYPMLEALAQEVVLNMQDLSHLEEVFKQLILASSEQEVHLLLKNLSKDA